MFTLPALIGIALVSIAVSLASPRLAMWTYALILLVPFVPRGRALAA
jgi:hypothetical protein